MKFKVGDKVRVLGARTRGGQDGVITEKGQQYDWRVTFPDGEWVAYNEAELEAVPMRGTSTTLEIDRSNYPERVTANTRVARNAGPTKYGWSGEHSRGVYVQVRNYLGDLEGQGISIEEARSMAAALTDLADRIEHDQELAKQAEQNSNAARKAELLRKTDELIQQANALRKEAEGL